MGIKILIAVSLAAVAVISGVSGRPEINIPVRTELRIKEEERVTENDLITCNCSFPDSRWCTPEGQCNALSVGTQLKKEVQLAKNIMKILWEFPGDRPRREMREQLCKILTALENVTDIAVLDFEEWSPACAKIQNPEKEIYTCSLAPKNHTFGKIPISEINEKIRAYHSFLKCPSTQQPSLIQGDFHFCRDGDFCNSVDRPYESVSELEQGLTRQQVIYYVIIPLLALIVLILLILAGIFTVYRATVWRYVYRVAKVSKGKGLTDSKSDVSSVPGPNIIIPQH